MAFTLDSTLGDLLAQPEVVKIIDQYIPGLSTNPLVGMAKGMSLRMVLSMPQAAQFGLTTEKAEAILAEANKVVK